MLVITRSAIAAGVVLNLGCSSGGSDTKPATTGDAGGGCSNGKRDPGETDIDCGATCGTCAEGKSCTADPDCTTGFCGPGYLCRAASCGNSMMDGPETGIDCGGDCPLCPGDSCSKDDQCATGFCKTGRCDNPACNDGIKNGKETGADCGAGDCSLCGEGQGCLVDGNCATGFCDPGGKCAKPPVEPGQVCTPLEKLCKGQDVFLCKAGGQDLELVKTCADDKACVDGDCVCKPSCGAKACGDDGCGGSCGSCKANEACQADGSCLCMPSCEDKECGDDGCGGPCGGCAAGVTCSPNGKCDCKPDCAGKACGDDGCGGSCGACGDGVTCSASGQCGCVASCEGKTCGDDGCGGLCNGCLDLVFDDGTTETAFGWSTEPEYKPTKVACLVRFELPQKGMKLTRFTPGWMAGLGALKVPYQLVYLPSGDVTCKQGKEESWYYEYCESQPDKLVTIGDFVTDVPYTPIEQAALGEVVLPTKTVYIGALFDLASPWPGPNGYHFCPVDKQGTGASSFMMPVWMDGDKPKLESGALKDKDGDPGAMPFSIRVQVSQP